MTDLQMGLIGLGSAAVVGVLAYNKWQEHQQRKVAEQVLNMRHTDVLLDEATTEVAAADTFESVDRVDPVEPDIQETVPIVDMEPSLAEPSLASFAGERIEPVLRLDPRLEEPGRASEAPLATAAPVAREPASQPGVATPATAMTAEPVAFTANEDSREAREPKDARESALPLYLLSPAIDYIAAFEAVEPAPAYQILESQREPLARVRKPLRWIGYNERSREWEQIVDAGDSDYRRIRIGLQLVDRHGPAADGDLSTFHIAMQDLADELMAVANLPPRQPALTAAAQLDQFCAGVDIQIGINVISQGQPFPGTKLRALAEAAGMALDVEGRFVRRDDDGNVLYVLTNQEAAGFAAESMRTMSTHGLTFLLDVPRVAHGDRVFNQMVDLARRFAEALHGSLVDDNRRPLSEGALEPIRRQVIQYQAAMAAQNLPAGGPLALRLFS
jgi:FtsZ-interacting cell division protein ZipA